MKKNMKKLNIYLIYLDLIFQKLIKLLGSKIKIGRNHLKYLVNNYMVNRKILQIYLREKIGLNNQNQN